MAAKTSWHRYGMKLRHCRPMYRGVRMTRTQCSFQTSYSSGGIRPHPKKLTIPVQTAAKLGRLHLLFYRGNKLQMYNGNILLMDNKHGKLFVSKQSKGCEFVPKMHQNTFRGRAAPGPAVGVYALPRPPRLNGGVLLRGGRERREEKGNGKGGKWNSPPPKSR